MSADGAAADCPADDTGDRTDVLIVGGGITGSVAALDLAEAGARVRVLDAGENAGSDANAGSLHVQLQSRFLRLFPDQAPNVEASLPLYLAAVAAWKALDQRLGGIELVAEGGLMVAEDAAQLAFLHKKAERERRHGLRVDVLDRAALERIAPYFGPEVAGAELCHDEGKLNPLLANKGLKRLMQAAGVRWTVDRATGLEAEGDRIRVTTASGRRYAADRAILANAWGAGALARGLGPSLPTAWEPLHMNITEPAAYALPHLVQHAERQITLKQFRSGQIVIGGGWPARFDGAGGTVPEVVADSLLGNVALAGRLVPAIRSLRLLRTWAGLNTTADGKSILGPLDRAGRVMAAVPGDAGYTLGPVIGAAAAKLAMGDTPAIDAVPLSPARFAA